MLHKSLFLSQVSLEPQLHSIQMTKILLLKYPINPWNLITPIQKLLSVLILTSLWLELLLRVDFLIKVLLMWGLNTRKNLCNCLSNVTKLRCVKCVGVTIWEKQPFTQKTEPTYDNDTKTKWDNLIPTWRSRRWNKKLGWLFNLLNFIIWLLVNIDFQFASIWIHLGDRHLKDYLG